MTAGNILALIQVGNLKRMLAYSSVAHSGYMLVGLTALAYAGGDDLDVSRNEALAGVLFYLAAYGIMNAGAFGILMLLPARRHDSQLANHRVSAETFEDIAGQGRAHPVLGLAMAVCMFSLIGLPLTVGFFGKLYLIKPALLGKCYWLVIIMLINAAISAGYYLKVVATMFLRPESYSAVVEPHEPDPATLLRSTPVLLGVMLSVAGTLLFGAIPPATQVLRNTVRPATAVDTRIVPGGGELTASPAPQARSAQGSARE
jgi:NADH-quinone oxidoreductase subunit N